MCSPPPSMLLFLDGGTKITTEDTMKAAGEALSVSGSLVLFCSFARVNPAWGYLTGSLGSYYSRLGD